MARVKSASLAPSQQNSSATDGNASGMPKSPEALVTLSWLNQIMNSYLRIAIQVTNYALEDATPRHRAFAGRFCKILVEYTEDPDSVSKTLSLSGKFLPDEEIFARIARKLKFFERETMFQHTFVKQVIRMQRVHPDRAMVPHIPKCVYASATSKITTIVLDDVEEYGFEVQTRQRGLSKDEVYLVMEALAKLHALGFMVIRKHKERARDMFYRFYSSYPYTSDEVKEAGPDRARHAELLLANVAGNTKNAALLASFFKRQSFVERHQYLNDSKFAIGCYCHGDCWSGNMMFKYDERSNGTGRPKRVRLFNFESTHFGHPAADLNQFFYSSTSKEVRRHMPEFLKLYYDEFFKYLRLLGVDFWPKNYSYKQFLIDFKRHSEIGLISACYVLPVLMYGRDYSVHVFGDPEGLRTLTNTADLSSSTSSHKHQQHHYSNVTDQHSVPPRAVSATAMDGDLRSTGSAENTFSTSQIIHSDSWKKRDREPVHNRRIVKRFADVVQDMVDLRILK